MNAILRLLLLCTALYAVAACQPVQRMAPVRGDPDVIRAAFAKTAAAPSYRLATAVHVGDDLQVEMAGAMQGADFRVTITGPGVAALGGAPTEPLELVHVDGRSFARNVGSTGLAPERWRELAEPLATDPQGQMLRKDVGRMLASGSLVTGHIAAGSLWCTAYRARPVTAAAVFADGNARMKANGSKTQILSGEIEFVICDDGYVHRVTTTATSITTDRPSFETTATTEIRLSDFGADIVIELPPHLFELETRHGYSL